MVIDGKERDVSFEELTLSNNLALEALARLLIDKKLLESKDLFVSQAVLTGESIPVEKYDTLGAVAEKSATAAASADAAVLLIAANEGVREQSRRHGYLLSLLGILVQFGAVYALTPTWALTGGAVAGLPFGIAMIGLLLWSFARKAAGHGWLR